ncbi:MAG TPA: hypothetical protein IAB57_02130 [Candidatus Fimivivens faecavium]|nr:hypothetical protein [Candidatus Fimivivens faecavium]
MKKRFVNVAVCQRAATGATSEENTADSMEMIERAAGMAPDLDVVLLPECNNFIASDHNRWPGAAQSIPGPYTDAMADLAKKLHVNLIPGSMTETGGNGKVRNTAVFINREGEILGRYTKIHLFDALGHEESEHAEAGDRVCVLDTDFGRIGIQICYDIRFPELARTQVLGGADILFVMACFPGGDALPPRTDHWDLLIDAMALQNQTWVCAANQYGSICGGREHPFGRSRITDPWGTPVAVAGNHKDIILARLDLDFAETCKRSIGGFLNRRAELYQI